MGNFGISATLLVPQWINRRNRCRQYIGNQLWKARQYLWSQRWFDVGPTLVAEVGCRCRSLVNERYHADVGQRRFPTLPRHLPTSGRRRPDLHLLPGLLKFQVRHFWRGKCPSRINLAWGTDFWRFRLDWSRGLAAMAAILSFRALEISIVRLPVVWSNEISFPHNFTFLSTVALLKLP